MLIIKDMERISRNQMFMEIAQTVAKRSTCTRKKVGAVLVKENRVIAIGYNGVLPGFKPEEGLNPDGSSNTVHAETNLIAFCAKNGIETKGTKLFVTLQPCLKCAELLIQAGIEKVIYLEPYRLKDGLKLLEIVGIPTIIIDPTKLI